MIEVVLLILLHDAIIMNSKCTLDMKDNEGQGCHKLMLTDFMSLVSFYIPWKYQRTRDCSYIFRGYRLRPVAWNELTKRFLLDINYEFSKNWQIDCINCVVKEHLKNNSAHSLVTVVSLYGHFGFNATIEAVGAINANVPPWTMGNLKKSNAAI